MPYYFRYNHPFKYKYKYVQLLGGAKAYFRPPPLFILGGGAPPLLAPPPAFYASASMYIGYWTLNQYYVLFAVKPLVQSKHLNFVYLNIRSLKSKTTSLFDCIVSPNLDVLALTEMWLCNGDNIILNELLPPGYDIRHVDREGEVVVHH